MAQIITETMSFFDVINIYEKDKPMLYHKIEAAVKKYEHQLKIRKNVKIRCEEVQGNRGLNYFIFFYNESLEDFRKNHAAFTVVAYYLLHNGFIAIDNRKSIYNKQTIEDVYTIYLPHFFDRYRERILKNEHIQKIDVIKQFFQKSLDPYAMISQQDERYPEGVYVTYRDGMGIGYRRQDKNIIIMKTCISNEQIHQNQVDKKEICERLIREFSIDPLLCAYR